MSEIRELSYKEFKEAKHPSFNNFSELANIFINGRRKIYHDFKNKLKVVESTLFETFMIEKFMHFRLEQIYHKNNPLDGAESLPPLYYTRNCNYLWASYELLLVSLNNPCLGTLRTVLETIFGIYFVHLTDVEADLIFKKETNNLSEEERSRVKKEFHNFRPWYIREELFAEKSRKKLKKLYKELSMRLHATFRSAASDFQYKPSVSEDNIKMLLSLSFSNIVAIWEVYNDNIFHNSQKDLESTLNPIIDELKAIPLLVPDSKRFYDKIRVRPTSTSE